LCGWFPLRMTRGGLWTGYVNVGVFVDEFREHRPMYR
jgi:hypothetical protein